MKFTLNWLKDHLDTDASLQEITDTLTAIGLELEGVEDSAAALADFTVAEIIEAAPHPDADRLQICKVNSDAGELQIVCGAPNARAGIKVALAKVGALIPNGDFKIKQSKIRGVESCGMLCSSTELNLGEDSEGIMELPLDAEIGTPIAEVLGLNDPVIDIAITPNRGDCLGVYGIARDLAAAGVGTLKAMPEIASSIRDAAGETSVSVTIQSKHCEAFHYQEVRGVNNPAAPEWLQQRLRAIGLRPISTLVDITNYFTFTYGRPLHVYDMAKLKGNITVRDAQAGESFAALNDKSYTMNGGECVIADESGMIGLGGIVGGESTGVDENTTDVLIECAWFAPIHIAENGRKLGVESDARYRFERTVDKGSVETGALLAAQMVQKLCGGTAHAPARAGDIALRDDVIPFEPEFTNGMAGITIDEAQQRTILEALGFTLNGDSITAPNWRPDVTQKADIAEEVLRIYRYDDIPAVPLPRTAAIMPNPRTPEQQRVSNIRSLLTSRHMLETHHFGFVSSEDASHFNVAEDEQITLQNPISSELSVMRPSLLPHLVSAAARNADRGASDVALFEIGNVFADSSNKGQKRMVAGVRSGLALAKDWHGESRTQDAFDAKADIFAICEAAGLQPEKLQLFADKTPSYFHPGRSTTLCLGPKNTIAHVGELHPALLKEMDAPERLVAFELFIDAMPLPKAKKKEALTRSDYQASTRDFAFIVDRTLPAGDLIKAIKNADKQLVQSVSLFDVYEGEHVEADKKSLAISVKIQSHSKTLSEEEIGSVSTAIIAASEKLGATLRG